MTFFERIAEDLKNEPFFKDFTYRKRDSSFIQRFEGGWRLVKFWHTTEGRLCTIYPLFIVRFDIASKWFEKFSYKTLSDQKEIGSVTFEGKMHGFPSYFDIPTQCTDYHEQYTALKDMVIKCSKYTFDTYQSICDIYYNIVMPQVDGEKEFPSSGADWFFQQLIISRIVDPKHFSKVMEIYLKHAAWMMSRNEPNIGAYYDRIHEIISYLENLDLEAMQKNPKKIILR